MVYFYPVLVKGLGYTNTVKAQYMTVSAPFNFAQEKSPPTPTHGTRPADTETEGAYLDCRASLHPRLRFLHRPHPGVPWGAHLRLHGARHGHVHHHVRRVQ